VAGQHPEPARVDGERFGEPVLHAEVRDPGRAGTGAGLRGERRRGRVHVGHRESRILRTGAAAVTPRVRYADAAGMMWEGPIHRTPCAAATVESMRLGPGERRASCPHAPAATRWVAAGVEAGPCRRAVPIT